MLKNYTFIKYTLTDTVSVYVSMLEFLIEMSIQRRWTLFLTEKPCKIVKVE